MGHPTFSESIVMLLQRSGWSPERSIDISRYVHALEADGYEVFPVVRDFLTRFGGLQIPYTYEPGYEDVLHFDAVAAAAAVYPEQVANYAKRLGTPLCIVGEYYAKHYTLMMNPQGNVYGGFDEVLNFLGDTGEQAIENIITGRNIKRLEA